MKRYIYIYSLLLAVVFSACDKRKYDVPEIDVPLYETSSKLISIDSLKLLAEPMILGSTSSETSNSFGYLQKPGSSNDLDENNVRKIVSFSQVGIVKRHLKAFVVGNDESGNIYKQIYLQDETGGILVIVNLTGLFGQFTVGQEVIIELDNLCIGKYYGAYQIGAPLISMSVSSSGKINYGMSRLTSRLLEENIHRNGLPDTAKVNSLCKTYASIPPSSESVRNTLVHLDNVSFDDGGNKQFAPLVNGKPTTGTVVLNVNGAKIDVRTSGYANFAGDIIPSGIGSMTAILSQYFDNLQITIRTRNDLNFNNK